MPEVPSEELAGALAVQVLGPYAAIVACLAVSLSCLTTAIALSSVSAEFIHIDLSRNKISYTMSLVIVMVLTFFVSTLHFDGIKMLLAPILEVSYPALILLSILNVLHKVYRVETVKIPVLVVFLLSLGFYIKDMLA
jgi:LIVCS family branched-chain amino acid:cation transporter